MDIYPVKTRKVGDTADPVKAQLLSETTRKPISLADASVKFVMLDTGTGETLVNSDATITDAPNGLFEYAWVSGDTSESGSYYAYFIITFTVETVESIRTFPNKGFIQIDIEELVP